MVMMNFCAMQCLLFQFKGGDSNKLLKKDLLPPLEHLYYARCNRPVPLQGDAVDGLTAHCAYNSLHIYHIKRPALLLLRSDCLFDCFVNVVHMRRYCELTVA
jgi:hypothetical protein